MPKKRGAYQRRGVNKLTREQRRQADQTNPRLYGRAIRASVDRFFSERGLPDPPISDNFIGTGDDPGATWNAAEWD
jgi:hypothetical protein